MKVMVIGHTYVVSANRGKLRSISKSSEIDLTVVCPRRWHEPDFGIRFFEPEQSSEMEFVNLPLSGSKTARKYHFHWGELKRVIQSKRPQIIQLEAEAGSIVSIQLSVLKLIYKFKLVLFTWDNIPAQRWHHRMAAAMSYPFVNYLIAGSDQAKQTARTQGYSGLVSILPQIGVDLKNYKSVVPMDPWKSQEGFRIGYVGRLSQKKGVQVLLEASAKIPEALVTIVGDGEYRTSLENHARSLGIYERVHFVGKVPHEDVARYIFGFDAFVLPSLSTPGWKEQFGHVLIEAMAAKKPVIASESGVIPTVIGNCGITFKEGDSKELEKSIRKMINDPDLAKHFSEKGFIRVKENFTDEAIAQKTLNIWEEVFVKK